MFVKFRWTLWSNTVTHIGFFTLKLGGFPHFLKGAISSSVDGYSPTGFKNTVMGERVYIYSTFLNNYTVFLALKIF